MTSGFPRSSSEPDALRRFPSAHLQNQQTRLETDDAARKAAIGADDFSEKASYLAGYSQVAATSRRTPSRACSRLHPSRAAGGRRALRGKGRPHGALSHPGARHDLRRAAGDVGQATQPIDVITLTADACATKACSTRSADRPSSRSSSPSSRPRRTRRYYLEIVQEKFTLREIIRVCTEYAARSLRRAGRTCTDAARRSGDAASSPSPKSASRTRPRA